MRKNKIHISLMLIFFISVLSGILLTTPKVVLAEGYVDYTTTSYHTIIDPNTLLTPDYMGSYKNGQVLISAYHQDYILVDIDKNPLYFDEDFDFFETKDGWVVTLIPVNGGTEFEIEYYQLYDVKDEMTFTERYVYEDPTKWAVNSKTGTYDRANFEYLGLDPEELEMLSYIYVDDPNIPEGALIYIGDEQTGPYTYQGRAVEAMYDPSWFKYQQQQQQQQANSNDAPDTIEAMIAKLLNVISNGLNKIVSKSLNNGKMLTIDSVVYNHYTATRIDFFFEMKDDGEYSELIWGPNGDGEGGLANTINEWYSFFRNIALIFYLIILVYMGIRILLASTGRGLEKSKELFMYWVIGLILLFFYPYVMKYIIKLNNAFVATVENSQMQILEGKIENITPAELAGTSGQSTITLNLSDNPFTGGTDYMAKMANTENKEYRVAFSFAYLILTWQLIILVLHYYKRLFMTAFLIVIFPLVMIFYALDKIADGKSQGFDKWNKEFILNVFVQSFHAIVYIFVVGTVYATGTGGNYDYVLVIMGATFLFTGEEIIKKIFSQTSSSITRPLGETMGKAIALTKVAENVGKKATGAVMGAGSVYNQARNIVADVKAGNTKKRLFNALAAPVQRQDSRTMHSTGVALARIDGNSNLSEEQKAEKRREVLKLGDAISTVNNAQNETSEDLAKAYQVIKEAYGKDPNNAQFNDLNVPPETIDKLERVNQQVVGMLSDEAVLASYAIEGESRDVTIKRCMEAELSAVLEFAGPDAEKLKRMYLANMAMYGTSRHLTRTDTHEEIEEARRELMGIADGFNFDYDKNGETNQTDARRNVKESWKAYIESATKDDENYRNVDFDSPEYKEEKEVATDIAIFRSRGSGTFDAKQQFDALSNLRKKANSGSALAKRMIEQMEEEEGVDVDIALNVLSHKITSDNDGNVTKDATLKRKAQAVAADYDSKAREGYYDDEVSADDVISGMFDDAKMAEIEQRMINERGKTNQEEREITKRIAQEMLDEQGIDIENDGGELYLDGQTYKDINIGMLNSVTNGVNKMVWGADKVDWGEALNHREWTERQNRIAELKAIAANATSKSEKEAAERELAGLYGVNHNYYNQRLNNSSRNRGNR